MNAVQEKAGKNFQFKMAQKCIFERLLSPKQNIRNRKYT